MDDALDKAHRYNYIVFTIGLRFEWDIQKDLLNRKKHKITFEEAKTAFFDENGLLIEDPAHPDREDRFILLGLSERMKLLVVCHVYRDKEQVIRIISARRAVKREQDQYWLRRRK